MPHQVQKTLASAANELYAQSPFSKPRPTLTLQDLIESAGISDLPYVKLLRLLGMPSLRYSHNPTAEGSYTTGTHEIEMNPSFPSVSLRNEVLRHELAHAFQHKTIGMAARNPTDVAIRQRLNLPQQDEDLDRDLAEQYAELLGNRQSSGQPLESMTLRAMLNQSFNKTLGRR